MALSTETVVAIVAVFIALPPTLIALWEVCDGPRRTQVQGTFPCRRHRRRVLPHLPLYHNHVAPVRSRLESPPHENWQGVRQLPDFEEEEEHPGLSNYQPSSISTRSHAIRMVALFSDERLEEITRSVPTELRDRSRTS